MSAVRPLSINSGSSWSSVQRTVYALPFRNIMLSNPLDDPRLFRLLLREVWRYWYFQIDKLNREVLARW